MRVDQVQFKWLTSVAIWLTYVVAMASPAVEVFGPVLGSQALQLGWHGADIVPELANVTLLLGWILLLFDKVQWAAIIATVGLLFALSALTLHGGWLLYGYYIWLSNHTLLLIASLFGVSRFGGTSSAFEP